MSGADSIQTSRRIFQFLRSGSFARLPRRPARLLPVAGLLGSVALPSFLFLQYIGLFSGNFRTVVPGEAYRSGQLAPAALDETIDRYGIRTVISLRGGSEKDGWFRRERQVCLESGVGLQKVRLDASRLPPPGEVIQLARLFRTSPKPVLFHCKAGADRAGLAAALYLHLEEEVPADQAKNEQLTWRYGHFPLETAAMDEFFDLYRETSNGKPMGRWLAEDYPAIYRREEAGSEAG